MKRLGIFGGSFNPIHLGHLGVAAQVKDLLALDEVWFVPLREHPLGEGKGRLLDAQPRVALIEEAIKNHAGFKLSRVEILREGPSYTVHTLEEIRAQLPAPQHMIFVILGVDAFARIEEWFEYRKLFELAHFAVVTRPNEEQSLERMKFIAGKLGFCYNDFTGNTLQIKSTERKYEEKFPHTEKISQAAPITTAPAKHVQPTNPSSSTASKEPPGGNHPRMVAEYRNTAGTSILAIELSPINVSSSEIRRRIGEGRDIAGLVPDGMIDTITEAYKHL